MKTLRGALDRWNDERKKHREGTPRLLIVADEAGFHARQVSCVVYDAVRDAKEYRVDRPLGSCEKVEDLPKLIHDALNLMGPVAA